jgi:hypothetical protein
MDRPDGSGRLHPHSRRGGLTIILFYSGRDGLSEPEVIQGGRGKKADIMLTYALSVKKSGRPTIRFAKLLQHRKKTGGKK